MLVKQTQDKAAWQEPSWLNICTKANVKESLNRTKQTELGYKERAGEKAKLGCVHKGQTKLRGHGEQMA